MSNVDVDELTMEQLASCISNLEQVMQSAATMIRILKETRRLRHMQQCAKTIEYLLHEAPMPGEDNAHIHREHTQENS